MKILMDRILRDCVEAEIEDHRLGRNGKKPSEAALLIKILMRYEERGDAMRYVDRHGRIAWQATPWLRELITDLENDVRLELEDEDI